ncbi:hypothetical protein K438DRAFT_1943841 [Mycena galopus ATCC 62051]|nr:hypothetical protein K438DRAFT_1943841 [Mycena galopus ATCC 62051]
MQRIRSKFTEKSMESPEMKDQRNTAVSYLQTVLLAAKDVAGNLGVPALSFGLGSLSVILDAIQKTSQNVDDVEELTMHLEGLNRTLSHVLEAGAIPSAVTERISGLTLRLMRIHDGVLSQGARNVFKRTLTNSQDAQWVKSQIQALSRAIETFTIETILHLEFMFDEQTEFVKASTDEIEGAQLKLMTV